MNATRKSAPAGGATAAVEVTDELLPGDLLPDDLLEVGHVLDAWGTHGWIKVAPDAAEPAGLLKAGRWWLRPPPGRAGAQARCCARRLARRHGQSVVALLEGVADRTQAESLKGWSVHLRREDFPAPAQDEFYWADLIGCEVFGRDGAALGQVVGLLDSGAQSVLRLRRPPQTQEGTREQAAARAERLIPFVDAYIVEVDIAARRIVADWQADYD